MIKRVRLAAAVEPGRPVGYQRAECPICDGSASLQVTWEGRRYLLRCWNCPHGSSGPWLSELARALDSNTDRLLRDPWGAGLIAAGSGSGSNGRRSGSGPDGRGARWGSFPSEWDIEHRSHELLTAASAMKARKWLKDERLIDRATIKLARVGWVSAAGRGYIVLPLFDQDGCLVNAKARRVGRGQMRSWPGAGRPTPLFPEVPSGRRVVLVAGELDALALVCAGVPAVSVTAGAGTWLDEYATALRNKRVTVAYDIGEEEAGERAASALKHARLFTWPVGKDATEFLKDGGDPGRIHR
jgi:hypothetical protein